MNSLKLLPEDYQSFEEVRFKNRFFKHADLQKVLDSVKEKPGFNITQEGFSTNGLSINLITWGGGPCRIFLWSQMHGDEATATMAIADLLNFLSEKDQFQEIRDLLAKNCTLYILPMVNPDGAAVFTRYNAMGIDINRDFLRQQSPEGRILRKLRDDIKPHFGFNLHDQSTTWSAGNTGNPATISLLAPAYDVALSINPIRERAMQVITEINDTLLKIIPEHIGRFDDEYDPRAFGDNFQASGTSTILIEAGGFYNDPEKQYIRKLYFKAILSGLISIADESYLKARTEDYFSIPENKKLHFHILLRNCKLQKNGIAYTMDVGLIAEEKISEDQLSVSYTYLIDELGDLSHYYGYKELDCEFFTLLETKKLKCGEPANIIVRDGPNILLTLEAGVLTNNNF